MIGRPREFEIDSALDAIVEAFWHGGYKGTSVEDLMAATGLHKGSLYKAFGGKHDMFVQSLGRYVAKIEAFHRESFAEDGSPRERLRRWFLRSADLCGGEGHFQGCLAINTITEMETMDPEIRSVLMGYYERMLILIAETISEGKAAGEFREDLDPMAAAQALFMQMGGFQVTIKAGIPAERAMIGVDQTLAMMGD